MKRISQCFTSDYRDDTMIEYVETGSYSMLNCSYTSEDPDYGTDTIHFVSKVALSIETLAFMMLQEVSDFLDYREGKIPSSLACDVDYDEYGQSTLIAIEKALSSIVGGYYPAKWYATIKDASRTIASVLKNDPGVVFSFRESDREEAKGDPEKRSEDGPWYGIKRISNLFTNHNDEFIIAAGQWGGGIVGLGYDNCDDLEAAEHAVCHAICEVTEWDADNMIFIEKETGRK